LRDVSVRSSKIADQLGKNGSQLDIIPSSPPEETSYISAREFSLSCSSLEQVGFKDVVRLFDVDRSRPMLERLFAPGVLKRYVYEKKRHRWNERRLAERILRRKSTTDSIASHASEHAQSDIEDLENRRSALSAVARANDNLEQKVTIIEERVQAQCLLQMQLQSTMEQHADELTNVHQKIKDCNASCTNDNSLQLNNNLQLVDRIEALEEFAASARKNADIFEEAENVVNTYSVIAEDLRALLAKRQRRSTPSTSVPGTHVENDSKSAPRPSTYDVSGVGTSQHPDVTGSPRSSPLLHDCCVRTTYQETS